MITVTNIGYRTGKEIVQLYVGKKGSRIMRAPKELKGFVKVKLHPGESNSVEILLDARSFAYYSVKKKDWCIEDGCYQIYSAASSRDIRLTEEIRGEGEDTDNFIPYLPQTMIQDGIMNVTTKAFETLFEAEIPYMPKSNLVTINSRFGDVLTMDAGRSVFGFMEEKVLAMFSGEDDSSKMIRSMLQEIPLRGLTMFTGGSMDKGKILKMIEQVNKEL